MNVMLRTGALAVLLPLSWPGLERAEGVVPWTVHLMCAEAGAIVAAERTGATRVRVTEWLLAPRGEEVAGSGAELEIVGLDEHTQVAGNGGTAGPGAEQERKILKSRRLVCFLERKGAGWQALGPGREGSFGLVWIEADVCYRYRQEANPGDSILVRDPDHPTERALRDGIALGLADRRQWETAMEIADPEEKAVVLASYLLTRSAPDGGHGTYLDRVRQELPRLGSAAVREVMELLRTAQPGDQLGPALLVLTDLGHEARAALPLVRPLLAQPELVPPVRVLEALGRMGDASVAPEILPFLRHDELPVRAEAAKALAVFRYRDAAGDIARSLPEEIAGKDAYYVYAILAALNDLDPAMAGGLARKYVNHPEMANLANLLEPFLIPEEEGQAP